VSLWTVWYLDSKRQPSRHDTIEAPDAVSAIMAYKVKHTDLSARISLMRFKAKPYVPTEDVS
jgi:hypothetical protein